MSQNITASDRCAIILAVGDGLRHRSFVASFRGARSFLRCVGEIDATLYDCFRRIRDALGAPRTLDAITEIYASAQPVNLSKGILEEVPKRFPSRLLVLPGGHAYRCDCGLKERILKFLGRAVQNHLYPKKPFNRKLARAG
jgi:hypothetical protein